MFDKLLTNPTNKNHLNAYLLLKSKMNFNKNNNNFINDLVDENYFENLYKKQQEKEEKEGDKENIKNITFYSKELITAGFY